MQTKITLGYLGFLPFAALTILPWILGETYEEISFQLLVVYGGCLLYTSPSPRDGLLSRMPSSA